MTAPPSTAAATSRELTRAFRALSPAQRRALMAIADLGEADWSDAMARARDAYGAARSLSHRTVQVLLDWRLVERVAIPNPHLPGKTYDVGRRLTPSGRMIEPLCRRWFVGAGS